MAKTQEGCGNVFWGMLHVAIDTPVIPLEAEIRPAPVPPSTAQPLQTEPAYEHQIEPLVYAVGHGFCLLLCLGVLWLLLQAPLEPRRVTTACALWGILAFVCYKAIRGVRYGCSIRIYRGYLELTNLAPMRVITAGEVAYFREFDRYSGRRKIFLYLRSGERVRLPRVHDPNNLWRSLLDAFGIQQMIA